MLTDDLFNQILVRPAAIGANRLLIVAGHAAAAMAFHHFQEIGARGLKVQIELIFGNLPHDGISLANHAGFQELSRKAAGIFRCRYICLPPAVNSKVYVWLKDDVPIAAFIGSADYTQSAFCGSREVFAEFDPVEGMRYFETLLPGTIDCLDLQANRFVEVFSDRLLLKQVTNVLFREDEEALPAMVGMEYLPTLPSICISFLANDQTLPQGSGLNWGQRPGREPNQAYIKLPSIVYKSDFFPPKGTYFTVYADDGEVLICTRAQENGKAIHTPADNSTIGKYFRRRLGIPMGAPVTIDDLEAYGRHDTCFYKIDDENFFMSFRVHGNNGG